MSHPNHFCFR